MAAEKKENGDNKVPRTVMEILCFVTVPLWFLLIPLGILINFVCLPYIVLKKVYLAKKNPPPLSVEVKVHGKEESKSLVFIHGWPDSAELWNGVTEKLKVKYRCVVLTLPGFSGIEKDHWGYDFFQVRNLIVDAIKAHTRSDEKITIVAHDWGCLYAYMVQDTLKGVVERMITLDVGSGGIEKSLSMTLFVATYQLFNAFCFLLGNPGGEIAQKIFLKKINYKARPHDEINVSMNYNYYYMWKILLSNFGSIQGFFPRYNSIDLDSCMVYYGYAVNKPGMFHSKKFIKYLESNEDCKVESFDCDHWITVHKGAEVSNSILQFLEVTDKKMDKKTK